jgi:hypothetical protein
MLSNKIGGLMEAEANFRLSDLQGNIKSEGKSKVNLDEKYLTLSAEFGEPMLFAYIDIVGISEQEYQVDLFLTSKEKLNLSGLGYQYEDFLTELFKLRNQLLLKYLLMDEALIKGDFKAQFTSKDPEENVNQSGTCEVRLYETALLVLPQKGEPIRVPYCYLTQTSKADYKLVLTTEFGDKLEFSMLGEKLDTLAKNLSEATNRLMLRSLQTIKEIIPEADPATLHKLAALMKDGRSAKRKDIDALSPTLWQRLTKKTQEAGINQEYTFLESKAFKEQMRIGIKRGLMGDLTGSYLWLLVPLLNDSGKLANAVALEAFPTKLNDTSNTETESINTEAEQTTKESEGETESQKGGKATYFFSILNRSNYLNATQENLQAELENFMKNIERSMIDINFRRDIIYLPDDQLENPKYVHYRFAIAKIPSLTILRNQFIGRVVHSSFDQWKSDVTSLLVFNAESEDDLAKWKKGVE